ncbi:hypothetical protein LJB86_05005 [Deltaproteobacteria bacterium OttesenSCG-928-M10]|nr:hypothetical protein [Deltaproteobacteria bacterium OttesenSCG-928-M10]
MLLSDNGQTRLDSQVSPRLWIQRLALFSKFSPDSIFQDIPFKRGFNLIVGLDSPKQDQEDNFGGHSVGKTTLCRLIRYCLGEPTFSTNNGQKLIRNRFKQGWVGCELYLDGVLWAVLLPFENSAQLGPVAGTDQTLEELFNCGDSQFLQYQQALEALVPPEANRAEVRFAWRHLLAWLTRDQKCIQDNFWDWRTAESESGSPQHRSRKKEGEHLVRSVLGLLVEKESDLIDEISKLHELLNTAKNAEKEAAELPALRKNMALKQLRKYCDLSSIKDGEPLPKLTFAAYLSEEKQKVMALEAEYDELRDKLADAKQAHRDWRKKQEEQEALLAPEKGYLDGLKQPHEEDPELAEIKAVENKECPASILYRDCERVQEVRKFLEQKKQGVDLKAAMSEKEYQRLSGVISNIESRLQEAKENELLSGQTVENLEREVGEVYKQLMAANRRYDAQKNHWEALQDTWDMPYSDAANVGHQQAVQNLKALEEERLYKENELKIARRDNYEKEKAVESIFDGLMKSIINISCQGRFVAAEDLNFSVTTNGDIGGDAVKAMRTVLGDFASMISSILPSGKHPGFLVHDSPRQSEVSLQWFDQFLKHMIERAEAAGGENAPYQYIVTTTLLPPEELRPYIRKEFASIPQEKLLFKERLRSPQQEMFE